MHRRLARTAAALALLSLCAGGPSRADRLTLLHTNDTHGHLLPFSYPEGRTGSRTLDSLRHRRDIGGIARRATLAREIRTECRAAGGTVLLLDAGDFCDGSPFSTEYHGEADLAAMIAAGYDFATFGNHEYNNSPEQVRSLLGRTRADGSPLRVLCANVLERDGTPLMAPYALVRTESLTVGLFGLTTEESATYPAVRAAFQVLPVEESARGISSALNRLGADLVVLISHCGEEVDRKLAAAAPALDVIVGGHSHSRLPAGEAFRPFEVSPADSNGTVIVQAHQWGGELGRLDLELRRDARGRWAVASHRAALLPITSQLAPDPRVAAVVDSFWRPIEPTYGAYLGAAKADFASRRRPDGSWDLANYNLMADAIRETFRTEIVLENLGGVRAPLVRGPITLGDLVTLDPFDNTIVTYELRGDDLRRLLERETPAVSGLSYRVVDGKLVWAKVGGRPLDDRRVYRGASNSYFAAGSLRGIEQTDTGRPRLEVLREYVRAKGKIAPKYDGRMQVIRD